MAEIRAIDRGTVSRVCSGQVITELRTAVKELVENALVRRAAVPRTRRRADQLATTARAWLTPFRHLRPRRPRIRMRARRPWK